MRDAGRVGDPVRTDFHLLRITHQVFAHGGERVTLRRPVEELLLEHAFEFGDPPADRRVLDAEVPGHHGKPSAPGELQEIPEVVPVERGDQAGRGSGFFQGTARITAESRLRRNGAGGRSSRSRDGCTATLRRRRRSRALTRHRATLAGCVSPTSSRRWARTADKKTADLHLLAGRLLHAVCHNQGAARSEQRCAAFDRGTLPQPRRLREPDPHRGLRPDRVRLPAARGRRDHHPGRGRASRVQRPAG